MATGILPRLQSPHPFPNLLAWEASPASIFPSLLTQIQDEYQGWGGGVLGGAAWKHLLPFKAQGLVGSCLTDIPMLIRPPMAPLVPKSPFPRSN